MAVTWPSSPRIRFSPAVRRPFRQRQPALIKRIDLADLRGVKGSSRQGHVGIASSFSQDLHLTVDSARPPMVGIRQCKVSVNKSIARLGGASPVREAGVLFCKTIAELDQLAPGIFGRVRGSDPVVQVNLKFPPSLSAMLG